jgi:hypothetical protein
MNDATTGTHADNEPLESVRRTDAFAGEPKILDPADGADQQWPEEAEVLPEAYLGETEKNLENAR